MQAVTALAHLKASILYMMDISEQCGRTLEEQINLFEGIQPLFANKPVFVGLNKIDIIGRSDLAEEKEALLREKLESAGIAVVELSTVSQKGITELRDKVSCSKFLYLRLRINLGPFNFFQMFFIFAFIFLFGLISLSSFPKACDALLSQRIEKKLQIKGGERGGDSVISRLFVAYPTPRDEKVRAPHIPDAVLRRRNAMEVDDGDEKPKRKLERELELEQGRDYYLDLKKHYLLKNEEEKYDVVPEIWEGHNIGTINQK